MGRSKQVRAVRSTRSIIYIVTLLLAAGCAPDIAETDFFSRHPDEPLGGEADIVELGSATVDGVEVRLLSESELTTGPNTILVEAIDAGTPVRSGSVTAVARWIGVDRELVPPFGRASVDTPNDADQFELLVHLLQPVGDAGNWVLDLTMEFGSGTSSERFEIDVAPDIWVQFVDAPEGLQDYYLSWIHPVRPETGEAPFELAMHRLTESGFEPLTGASLNLYPYMDMGGGEGHSTPFEAPVHVGDGVYTGTVNFIMAGGWDMTVYVQSESTNDTIVFRGFTVY